jgi:hypothetical protein
LSKIRERFGVEAERETSVPQVLPQVA